MPEPDEDSTARVEADEADKDASPPFNNTSVNTSDALIASGQESLAVRQQSTLILALTAENPSHEEGGEGVSSVEVSGPVTTDTQLQSLSLVVPSVVPTSTEMNITKEVISSADTRVKEMQLIGHESATIKEKYVDRESRREFDGTVDTMDAEHAVSQASLLLEEGTAENATAQPPVSTEAIRRPTPLQDLSRPDSGRSCMGGEKEVPVSAQSASSTLPGAFAVRGIDAADDLDSSEEMSATPIVTSAIAWMSKFLQYHHCRYLWGARSKHSSKKTLTTIFGKTS
jgi:hypothetical protein